MKKLIILIIAIFTISFANAQTPTITSFSPTSGTVGSLVTITGTNLINPTSFTIGGTNAIVVSNNGIKLVGMVMPGATTGNITITTTSGTVISGSNFIVNINSYPFIQQGNKIVDTTCALNSKQGFAVALSADGNTAIIGSIYDTLTGSARIYTRNGGIWSQQGPKLIGTGGNLPTCNGNLQGSAVALSADGNTALVGGRGDSLTFGAFWFFIRNGGVWTQQGGKMIGSGAIGQPSQGFSVGLSADGNTAIIGGDSDNGNIGAAWIFTRNGSIWTQQGNKLVDTTTTSNNFYQGMSVALSADGNTAIVGGPEYITSGGAWIYTRNGGVWTQQGSKLVGTGAVGASLQGRSVSLSADGNTAIIGAMGDNNSKGAAWGIYPKWRSMDSAR